MNLFKQPPFFLSLVGILAGVVAIEQATTFTVGDLTLAPPLSIIGLGLMAVFFNWKQVLFSTPLFVITSYYLILGSAHFPIIRALSVLLAGILAAWAARQRQQIENPSREINQVLEALSVPWILSDSIGNITRVSQEAALLISLPADTIIGTSFFSFFTPTKGKGEFIRMYLDAFETPALPAKASLAISRADTQSIKVNANFSRLDCADGLRLLTVLELQKRQENP